MSFILLISKAICQAGSISGFLEACVTICEFILDSVGGFAQDEGLTFDVHPVTLEKSSLYGLLLYTLYVVNPSPEAGAAAGTAADVDDVVTRGEEVADVGEVAEVADVAEVDEVEVVLFPEPSSAELPEPSVDVFFNPVLNPSR